MSASNTAARQMTMTDSALAQARAAIAARTEKRMRDGKRLILIGFVVAVLGIVSYCVVGLSAPARQGAVTGLGDFVGPSLAVIGLGTLVWLVGTILFLGGAMDSKAGGVDVEF